jgi:hypothetical protein
VIKMWVVWDINNYDGSTAMGFFSNEDAANECCEALRAMRKSNGMEKFFEYGATQETLHESYLEWAAKEEAK